VRSLDREELNELLVKCWMTHDVESRTRSELSLHLSHSLNIILLERSLFRRRLPALQNRYFPHPSTGSVEKHDISQSTDFLPEHS
jgi:hypothetical protein